MKEYLSEIKQVLEEQNTKENGLSSCYDFINFIRI